MKAFKIIALLSFILAGQHATAAVVNASNSGFYFDNGGHLPTFHGAGLLYVQDVVSPSREIRNYFVFDLSGIGTVSSAVLRAYLFADGYVGPDSSETWSLFEVTTDVPLLGTSGVSIFDDLGSGVAYGSVSVSASDEGSFVEVVLGADALTSLSASSGLWAIGGAVTTLSAAGGTFSEYIFSSIEDVRVELVVNAVPIPAAAWLFGSALLGLVGIGRRNKA